MKYKVLLVCSFFLFCTYLQAQRTVWLDELDLSKVDQSAGDAVARKSMWNTPLIIAGEKFKRGVGTHAESFFRIQLDGKTTFFKALVGIDDSAPAFELAQASAEFLVIGDGKILWKSGIMHGGDKAKDINLSTKGIKSLLLRVDHCGDGITGDRANWVNACFEVKGKDPVAVSKKREPEYILTPLASNAPKINAPYIYGARPGKPFLFTVPISGARPLNVEAGNLPDGLSIDAQTGIISGTAKEKGTYLVDVVAENSYGKDTQKLTLEIGDKLALTPPMGLSTWNVFGDDIDDAKIRRMADAMVETGLINYGYAYINIDDGWQGERGGKYHAIMPNEKFPDMKGLVDYVHSKGLKIGIYSSPWVETFAGYIGGGADTRDGKVVNSSKRYGEYSFVKNDVQQWVEWGFDYLTYDWITNDIAHTAEMTYLLDKANRDIVFSISNAAPFALAEDWSNLTNLWRTTGDIQDTWSSMTTIVFLQGKWKSYAKPGSWSDPDMLIVGKLGWGKELRNTRLTPNEQYLHISLWSILAAPLLVGCDISQLDDFTKNLLCNNEVIAVDQDMAGIPGSRIFMDKDEQIEIWSRPLSDGSQAVGLFNLSDETKKIAVNEEMLDIKGKFSVRNLWEQKEKGTFSGKYSSDVPSHGVVFIKVTKLD